MYLMYKEINWGRNFRVVFFCGIFIFIKIFWLVFVENIYVCLSYLSKILLLGKRIVLINIFSDIFC